MKIIVLLKQTPDTETKIQVSSDGKNIDHSQTKFVVNPYDEYGIEEAIKIREKSGQGEVVLLSFAPLAAKERMLRGLAMGADRAVLVDQQGYENCDSLGVARVLSEVVKSEQPDMVFCGKQAIDDDNMQVGVMLAELLKWPHVNVVNELTVEGSSLRVCREVEAGQTEVYQASTPIVIGANKSLNNPRYASLPGIMKAKRKPFECKKPADFGIADEQLSPQVEVESYQYPPEKPQGKIFKDEPVEVMVDKLVKLLREEAKVI